MKHFILKRLKILYDRYKKVQTLLKDSSIAFNQHHFRSLSYEYSQLNTVFHFFSEWKKIQKDIKIANIMLSDAEMREMAQEELNDAKINLEKIEKELKVLLLPKDPDDELSAFIEIRAGTGGNEAAIFSNDLFRMYLRYADTRSWHVDTLNISRGEYGGYKEIIAKISGKGVYGRLKFESGGHRVQRVPITESQGRIHTSTCTVAVMPVLPEKKMPHINLTDLRIDTFRSSGAGGQHVNTTDSAIRITHLPTGIVVECQDERSQHKNKAKALSVLCSRIHAEEIEKRRQNLASTRRNLLGNGDRSNRNRTYNFPQRRVTDHRINFTIYRLEDIMSGNLDILIEPIIDEYQADQMLILTEEE